MKYLLLSSESLHLLDALQFVKRALSRTWVGLDRLRSRVREWVFLSSSGSVLRLPTQPPSVSHTLQRKFEGSKVLVETVTESFGVRDFPVPTVPENGSLTSGVKRIRINF